MLLKWSYEAQNAPTEARQKHAIRMSQRMAQIAAAIQADNPMLAVYIAVLNSDLSAILCPREGSTVRAMSAGSIALLRAFGATVADGAKVDLAMYLPAMGRSGRPQRTGGAKGARIVAESRPSDDDIRTAFFQAKDNGESLSAARHAVVARFKKDRCIVSLRRVQNLTTSGKRGRPNK